MSDPAIENLTPRLEQFSTLPDPYVQRISKELADAQLELTTAELLFTEARERVNTSAADVQHKSQELESAKKTSALDQQRLCEQERVVTYLRQRLKLKVLDHQGAQQIVGEHVTPPEVKTEPQELPVKPAPTKPIDTMNGKRKRSGTPCRLFNGGNCSSPTCEEPHSCANCFSSDHPYLTCTKLQEICSRFNFAESHTTLKCSRAHRCVLCLSDTHHLLECTVREGLNTKLYCICFNSSAECKVKGCDRRHRCLRCDGEHASHRCPINVGQLFLDQDPAAIKGGILKRLGAGTARFEIKNQ